MKLKGFTLVEVMSTIAILGILSAIVVASLDSARIKGRDGKRIADIKLLQQGLESYFDSCSTYPTTLAALSAPDCKGLKTLANAPYEPLPPPYLPYAYYKTDASDPVLHAGFHLCAILEKDFNVPSSKARKAPYDVVNDHCNGVDSKVYDVIGGAYQN